jgi:hypothetical protein
MMNEFYDSTDPYGGGGGGGYDGGDSGSGDSGEPTGGSDPTNPPRWKPTPNGWWEFIGGVWRWVTEPARTLSTTT